MVPQKCCHDSLDFFSHDGSFPRAADHRPQARREPLRHPSLDVERGVTALLRRAFADANRAVVFRKAFTAARYSQHDLIDGRGLSAWSSSCNHPDVDLSSLAVLEGPLRLMREVGVL